MKKLPHLLVGMACVALLSSYTRSSRAASNEDWSDIEQSIQREIPDALQVRWPDPNLLISFPKDGADLPKISFIASPTSFSIYLSNCRESMETSLCAAGVVQTSILTNEDAQQDFKKHKQGFTPITLAPGVRGFFLDHTDETSGGLFSSVMWAQDDFFYTVQLPAEARQQLLYMARSMAINDPIQPMEDSGDYAPLQLAQSATPNEDRFLQAPVSPVLPFNNRQDVINSISEEVPQESDFEPSSPSSQESVLVRDIQVQGSTVFNQEELEAIVQPFEGQQLTPEGLREIADKVTRLYLENDYITSRAIPLDTSQIEEDGIAIFQISEGEVSKINIEGLQRLRPGYIRSRIALGANVPLSTAELEDQLKLLRSDPLIRSIEASLRPTGEQGQSKLIVRVTESNPFNVTLSSDNYSPPSVGPNRLGVSVRHRNLTGLGDEAAASFFWTTSGGAQVGDFSYRVPVNAKDGSLQFRFAPTWNRVTSSDLEELNISGENQLYSLNYRQPLIRSPLEDLAVTVGLTHRNGQTFIFDGRPFSFASGADEDGVSRTAVLQFGQDYIRRDPKGAWSFRSQFNLGTDWLDATLNNNSVPDGRFFSWQGQGQRIQRLNDNHLLIAQGSLQLTPDTLLPSQQFVIGGGQSVRGYRQNVRSADNGFRFSIEDRITLDRNESGAAIIQIAPFWDIGTVWNTTGNPNQLPEQRWLSSIGFGFLWEEFFEIDGLSIRFDYGIPLFHISDQENDLQDQGLHFGVTYQP